MAGTSTAALWLAGGGGLPDTCDSDLVACERDLSTTNADLTSCEGDLSTTNADLTTCEGDLAACQANSGLSKTGQTICYNTANAPISCANTGQDGESQKGAARSFTDNGDGTISDNLTGLMWEKQSDDGSIHDKDNFYAWGNIFASKVATLNSTVFAGYSDLRVPNVVELQSLVRFGHYFPPTYSAFNTSCAASCTVLTCRCWSPAGQAHAPSVQTSPAAHTTSQLPQLSASVSGSTQVPPQSSSPAAHGEPIGAHTMLVTFNSIGWSPNWSVTSTAGWTLGQVAL